MTIHVYISERITFIWQSFPHLNCLVARLRFKGSFKNEVRVSLFVCVVRYLEKKDQYDDDGAGERSIS